jgi:hypothetical protein
MITALRHMLLHKQEFSRSNLHHNTKNIAKNVRGSYFRKYQVAMLLKGRCDIRNAVYKDDVQTF